MYNNIYNFVNNKHWHCRCFITHLFPMTLALAPENIRKLYVFLFSGGRERVHWENWVKSFEFVLFFLFVLVLEVFHKFSTYFTGTIIWAPKLSLFSKMFKLSAFFNSAVKYLSDCTNSLKTKFARSYVSSVHGDTLCIF